MFDFKTNSNERRSTVGNPNATETKRVKIKNGENTKRKYNEKGKKKKKWKPKRHLRQSRTSTQRQRILKTRI